MFSPDRGIRLGLIVDASEPLELINFNISNLNPKLMLKLTLGSTLDTNVVLFILFILKVIERMGTTGVGPSKGEGDLGGGTLLEKELTLRVEETDRESTVEHTLGDVLVEVG